MLLGGIYYEKWNKKEKCREGWNNCIFAVAIIFDSVPIYKFCGHDFLCYKYYELWASNF